MNLKIYKITQLKFLEPFISVAFLILMLASPLLFGRFEDEIDWEHIFRVWISFLPFIAIYLINRFVFLPLLFFRDSRWLYLISTVLLIVALALVVHLFLPHVFLSRYERNLSEAMAPFGEADPGDRFQGPKEGPPGLREGPPGPKEGPPGPREHPPGKEPPKQLPPLISFMVVSVLIIGFDTGLMISVKWAQSEQQRTRAEKESAESQLAFLQNQVSPHFFMNTLNNIHSLIDIDTDEAKESIIKLSKLMRHLLYDSQVERIPLKKEIEFIQNYVELMRLRFSDKVTITLHIPHVIPDKSIPPLLFTSFVENAFKHGISYQEKSFIDIRFSFGPDQLYFTLRNSNPGLKKEEAASGIGIENSRKRLDLLYGDSYELKIEENKEEFTIHLYVPV